MFIFVANSFIIMFFFFYPFTIFFKGNGMLP